MVSRRALPLLLTALVLAPSTSGAAQPVPAFQDSFATRRNPRVLGDMYEADISKATVLALFLLPDNLNRLAPKFMALKPGARIVANSFEIEGWEADERATVAGDCGSWCTAHLYIVPAKVAGTWRLPQGLLTLQQRFQVLSGTLWSGGLRTPIASGRLRGDQIRFSLGGVVYSGRVSGDVIHGAKDAWTATRVSGQPVSLKRRPRSMG